MKNADLPAMPYMQLSWSHNDGWEPTLQHEGLTKREEFVKAAMQALLVNAGRNGLEFGNVYEESMRQADLHLNALEQAK